MPHARSREAQTRRAGRRAERRLAIQEAAREARVQALQAAGAARLDGPVAFLLAATAASAGSPRGTRVPAPALTGWCQGGRKPTAAEQALLSAAQVQARLLDAEGRLTPVGEEWLLQRQRRAPALAVGRRRAEEADPDGPLSDQAQALGDEAERHRMYRAAGDWARQLAAGSGRERRGEEYARVPAAASIDEDEQEARRDLMLAVKHRRGRLAAGGTIFVPTGGLTVAAAVADAWLAEEARVAARVARRGAARGYTTIWPLAWALAAGAAVACIAFAMHP